MREAGCDSGDGVRVVRDAGGEAGGELGEDAAGVGEEDAEGGVAVECAGEDEAGYCGGGFEGEAEREGEDVAVVFGAERRGADAVVRVEEDEEVRRGEGGPDGFEPLVVEADAEASGAHDDAFEVGEGGDLGDGFEEEGRGDVVAEREEAEGVEALERRVGGDFGGGAAEGVEVCVEVFREGVGVGGGEEVEPGVRWAVVVPSTPLSFSLDCKAHT